MRNYDEDVKDKATKEGKAPVLGKGVLPENQPVVVTAKLASKTAKKKIKENGGATRAGKACQGQLSSASTQLGKSGPVDDHKVNGVGDLGGITLNLNANVEVDPGTKQEGTSSSKASSDEGYGKLNGNPRGSLLQNGNVDEKRDQGGFYFGGC
ncbi:hypothetical protein Cgig2_010187 [Carnegiea gigantea]|uniref:Large ribosomal subunit protein uL15/eL18 domain-containing protein n=1 Tax=Carnegiea gigantea TaxID=171969 RepID=A0A9Q1KB38_9CARY|nr:hypothetical protein Cgig2_010187 [Carnegiea gigantea]